MSHITAENYVKPSKEMDGPFESSQEWLRLSLLGFWWWSSAKNEYRKVYQASEQFARPFSDGWHRQEFPCESVIQGPPCSQEDQASHHHLLGHLPVLSANGSGRKWGGTKLLHLQTIPKGPFKTFWAEQGENKPGILCQQESIAKCQLSSHCSCCGRPPAIYSSRGNHNSNTEREKFLQREKKKKTKLMNIHNFPSKVSSSHRLSSAD